MHVACMLRSGSTHTAGSSNHWLLHNHTSTFEALFGCRVFVNAILSGVQQRNLESAWGLPVLDRMGLIIEIFGQRARSREALLQVP